MEGKITNTAVNRRGLILVAKIQYFLDAEGMLPQTLKEHMVSATA